MSSINLPAERGDVAGIAAALDAGADVDERWGHWTPLVRAARWGHAGAAQLLLARGADPDASGVDCTTPLQAAVEGAYIDVVRILLAAGADVSAGLESAHRTPIHLAAARHDVAMLELLLSAPGGHDVASSAVDMFNRGVMHEWAELAGFIAQRALSVDSAEMTTAMSAAKLLRGAGARTDLSASSESFNYRTSKYGPGTLPLAELETLASCGAVSGPDAVNSAGSVVTDRDRRVADAARALLAACI